VHAKRQTARLGVALRDAYPWSDLASVVNLAEAAGYEAVFLPEVGVRDTLATLTGLAGETTSILLATGVVPLPSRSPSLLAMAAATAQERSGGRVILGIGTGPSGPGALERLREVVTALRWLFAGGEATLDGKRLDLGLVPAAPPPIWIAALGPRAGRLAGQIADGVILNWCTPERVVTARAEVAEGAEAAGRDPADVTVAVYVRSCLDGDPATRRDAVRPVVAGYAGSAAYARQFASLGLGRSAAAAANAGRAGRFDDVPDDLVEATCLVDDQTAGARIQAYREAGADLPIVYPVLVEGRPLADSAAATIRALAHV